MDHSRLGDHRQKGARGRLAGRVTLMVWLATGALLPAIPIAIPRTPSGRPGATSQSPEIPSGKVLKEGQLTKAQFRSRLYALANSQMVDWKGRSLTKLAFLAEAGRRIKTAHLQARQQAAPHAQAELAAARSRFAAAAAAKLAAANEQARSAAQQRIAELLAGAPAPGEAATALTEDVSANGGSAGGGMDRAVLDAGSAGDSGNTEGPVAGRSSCTAPRITYAPPFALSPGSYVAVVGCGFGAPAPAAESRLLLRLQSAKVDVPLDVQEWHDGWIAATVPAGLAGLLDQGAQLVVRLAPGAADESSGWQVAFRAAREMRALRSGEVQIDRCGAEADANYCNHLAHLDSGYWGLLDKSGAANPAEPFTSAGGYHADDASPDKDEGVDVYHVRLGHGWTLASFAFHFEAAPGSGGAAPPEAFEPGYAEQVLTVPWAISGEGAVVYYLDLFAVGPRGTNP